MICDQGDSDTDNSIMANNRPGGVDLEFSELAPRKLFDSTDTIINIADDILDEGKQTQNTFGTPVILRRGQYNARYPKEIVWIVGSVKSSRS